MDTTPHHDAAMLLHAEHAVARVLVETCDEATAYPRLLSAIGESLGWKVGALWAPADDDAGALRCVETWQGREPFEQASRRTSLAPGEGLPGRVWASGEAAWIADVRADANFPRAPSAARAGLRTAFCFPIRGATDVLGAIEFLASEGREPDHDLLETMTSLGGRIGQCVERWRGEDRLRESDARKTAMLDAAFDCIITMDADGHVVEVNRATERTFGYTADEMVGRELAELIIPPALREPHRHGVAQYVATGEGKLLGHPVELPAMRADGSEFPVEIAITQPQVEGPPQFTGYVRDVTHRKRDEQALRSLAEEQAALRRVATAVASEADQERLFARRDRGGRPPAGRQLVQHAALRARRHGGGRGRVEHRRRRGGPRRNPRDARRADRRGRRSCAAAARRGSTASRAWRARRPRCCASSGSARPSARRSCCRAGCGAR